MGKLPWWRPLLCMIGACLHRATSNEDACWGECTYCGHVAGKTSRAAIRAYMARKEKEEDLHG